MRFFSLGIMTFVNRRFGPGFDPIFNFLTILIVVVVIFIIRLATIFCEVFL